MSKKKKTTRRRAAPRAQRKASRSKPSRKAPVKSPKNVDLFNIRPQDVDLDFDDDPTAMEGFFGCHIDPAEKSDPMCGQFNSAWIIPKAEWKDMVEFIEEKKTALPYYRIHRNNQNPESSCVHNVAEVVRDCMRSKTLGLPYHIKCSPMSSYCRVTTRRHSGSMMWGALQATKAGIRGNGQMPEDNPRNRAIFGKHVFHQNTPFAYNHGAKYYKDGWQDVAQWFTVVEWYAINSYEEFVSALIRGWGVCYGRSGHSIAGLQPVMYQGSVACKYLDSYGHGRGTDGYLIDTWRKMSTGGAWCCREVTLPPNLARPWEPCGDVDYVKLLSREKFLKSDGFGKCDRSQILTMPDIAV